MLTHDDYDFEAEYFDALLEEDIFFSSGCQYVEVEDL